MKKITIAIDGYSSCGKSTMAKALANKIGYVFVDTGAMYRAATLVALRHNLFDENNNIDTPQLEAVFANTLISQQNNPTNGTTETFLNGQNVENEIRSMEVSSRVSLVAALPFVRSIMVKLQQEMGRDGGVVMDGRDIGTTVFPQAQLKVFVTASPEVRVKRRYEELKAKGMEVSIEEVARNLSERDYIDTHRQESPLRQAADAVVLDNTNLSRQEQFAMLLALFNERTKD